MIHRVKGRKLGRTTAHRQMLARNMVTNLFKYGRIITTVAKAKEFRGLADRLIVWAKKGGLHNFRKCLSYITDKRVAHKLFKDIAKRFPDRPSGFTRVLRLGGSRWDGDGHGLYAMTRLGDNGERAIWELVVRKEPEEELYLAGYGARAREEREAARLAKKSGKKPEGK